MGSGVQDQSLTLRRRAWVAGESFAIGVVAIGALQLFLRLPLNWLVALCFLWFSLKTIRLFAILRPDRSVAFGSAHELGVIGIAHLALIVLAGGIAWLSARSLTAGGLTATVLYGVGYVILRKRFRWHPFATG
jgi:hypothetical protein